MNPGHSQTTTAVHYPTAKDAAIAALEDAAALIELLRARIEDQRGELDTAAINWIEAATAQRLARELLDVATMSEYGAEPEEATRQRVLNAARERLALIEGRAEQASPAPH